MDIINTNMFFISHITTNILSSIENALLNGSIQLEDKNIDVKIF